MRCADCPVPAGVACLRESRRHERFCAPAWRGSIVALSLAEGLPADDLPPVAAPDPDAGAIEACDFRRSSCGCLSKPATCLQAGYPAETDLAGCKACLARRRDAARHNGGGDETHRAPRARGTP